MLYSKLYFDTSSFTNRNHRNSGPRFPENTRDFFFALARELFSSRTKTKIFSSHVFRNA
ncbi:DUF1661 domain-containing protein [Porphyromonas gingivalis]|nr:DUF1661 domain-containing protein [Porphyromonas gingivalis]QUI90645.1 DUF1661 domain-containing protein [Porphyromonas gingivalis]QUI92585.1 DUF1661 domain-containing protein [Porphyromonas gingivalis]RZQ68494.1 DUF1661 domain-containing protein [Porphyromonas gingivalis]